MDQLPAPPRHRRRHLTVEEWRRLLKQARNPFERALLHVLYDLCLRAHEPGKLVIAHARELPRGMMYAPRGKGSRAGWLDVTASTRSAVHEWLKVRYPDVPGRRAEDWLFPARDGRGGISRFTVYRIVQQLGVQAGLSLEMSHPHAIRHGFIMHVMEAGLAKGLSASEIVAYLAPRVGHQTANTTVQHYISETKGAAKLIRDVVRENLK